MSALLRIAAVIVVFALVAPPLGTALLIAVSASLTSQWPLSNAPADLAYSVVELGHLAAIGGAVFAAGVYFTLGRYPLASKPLGRAALGGMSMLVVFGFLFAHKLVFYGHASSVLGLIASLATVSGAAIGVSYPNRFLPRKHHNAA